MSSPLKTNLGLAVRDRDVVPLPYTQCTTREGPRRAIFSDRARIADSHTQLPFTVQRYCEARLVTLGRQCEEVAR